MNDRRYDRRTVLKSALAGLAALPASGLICQAASAQAAATASPPHVDEKDSLALAMGYVHDAKKVDPAKSPQYKAGSKCSNCLQMTGKEGDQWRPCNIFPGKVVNADGWCKVWVVKPGAKVG